MCLKVDCAQILSYYCVNIAVCSIHLTELHFQSINIFVVSEISGLLSHSPVKEQKSDSDLRTITEPISWNNYEDVG